MAQDELEFALVIGMLVTLSESTTGRISTVLLRSKPWRVEALVVRSGFLTRHTAVIPWAHVADVNDAQAISTQRVNGFAHRVVVLFLHQPPCWGMLAL